MGTYINCKAKHEYEIDEINAMWNTENPGFEDTFHLCTHEDMKAWLQEIHMEPGAEHLRYIRTVEELNKIFSLWGLGTFQVKITGGDYLCSEMAKRYIRFFDKWSDEYFVEHPLNREDVREIVEEIAVENHKAKNCLAECLYCTKSVPVIDGEVDRFAIELA